MSRILAARNLTRRLCRSANAAGGSVAPQTAARCACGAVNPPHERMAMILQRLSLFLSFLAAGTNQIRRVRSGPKSDETNGHSPDSEPGCTLNTSLESITMRLSLLERNFISTSCLHTKELALCHYKCNMSLVRPRGVQTKTGRTWGQLRTHTECRIYEIAIKVDRQDFP